MNPKDIALARAKELLRLASESTGEAQAEYQRQLRALLPDGSPLADVLDAKLRQDDPK